MNAFKSINLLLLASIIGIELFCGIVVAKNIFYPPTSFNGEAIIDTFGSGLIMGQIFLKLGYVLLIVSVFNALYEFAALGQKFNFFIKISKILLVLINLALSLLFIFYYTQPMLDLQSEIIAGTTGIEALASEDFQSKHTQSELLVKILLLLQVVLFFLSFKTAKNEYN